MMEEWDYPEGWCSIKEYGLPEVGTKIIAYDAMFDNIDTIVVESEYIDPDYTHFKILSEERPDGYKDRK